MVHTSRKGAATVELAICLPLVFLLVFGGIEAANGIFLKQGLTAAAYEAAKVATSVGGTHQSALTRGREILTSRGFGGADVTIVPSVDQHTPPGTHVRVTATAPASANSISPLTVHSEGMTVSATVVMAKN